MSDCRPVHSQEPPRRFSSEDKYCIHFRFIIHMSNTQAVPATADLREREEVDENNQV